VYIYLPWITLERPALIWSILLALQLPEYLLSSPTLNRPQRNPIRWVPTLRLGCCLRPIWRPGCLSPQVKLVADIRSKLNHPLRLPTSWTASKIRVDLVPLPSAKQFIFHHSVIILSSLVLILYPLTVLGTVYLLLAIVSQYEIRRVVTVGGNNTLYSYSIVLRPSDRFTFIRNQDQQFIDRTFKQTPKNNGFHSHRH